MSRVSVRLAAATAVALVAVPAALGAVGASAGAARPAWTKVEKVYPVHDGPDGRHTTAIDTALYVPTSRVPAGGRPVILMTHGFGLSKDAAEVTSYADFFARHGYLVLTYTSAGFGKSGGCITLDSVDWDVKDAKALLDKVIEPRHDVKRDAHHRPVVGMVGGSYGGGITLLMAEHDPRIRAIAPGRTWNTLAYSLMPNNWITPGDPTGFTFQRATNGVFKAEWTSLFFADGNAMPAQGDGGCPQDKLASGDPTTVAGLPCLGYPADVCEVYARAAATGDADAAARALLARSSGSTFIDRLRVPTLLVQGEPDTLFNLNEAVATYLALRRRHVPVEMIWDSAGHGGYDSHPGEGEVYGGGTTHLDQSYLPLRTLAWFDRWLKGARVDTGPGFAYYRAWVPYSGHGPDTGQYGTATAFPAQAPVQFLLSGKTGPTRFLAPKGYVVLPGSDTIVRDPTLPPSYTETSNCTGPQAGSPCPPGGVRTPPSDTPGESVSFRSAPFRADVLSVGVPRVHLHLSHSSPGDLILFLKVFDVAPDGSTTLIHRLVAPVRVPSTALGRAVDAHLLGFAHLFRKGHAVQLTLATTDATSMMGAATDTPDAITVSYGDHATPGDNPNDQLKQLEGAGDVSWFDLPVDNAAKVSPAYGPNPN